MERRTDALVTSHETVIVGGGIAGLACARRLHDRQGPFLLISESVGGRVRRSADGTANLGAYYVRADYTHVNQFVDRGRRIRRRDILRGVGAESFSRSDLPLFKHVPETVRFLRLMSEFRRHYASFQRECEYTSQEAVIEASTYLRELYREPANEFIARHRITTIARTYLAPAIHGTGFTDVDGLNAFTLLVAVLPTVIPMFEYTFRPEVLMDGFERHLSVDSVTSISRTNDGYSIQTRSGAIYAAHNVVLATPTGVSGKLLDLGPVKQPISAHMFLVRGTLLPPWATTIVTLFPPGETTFGIARQVDGSTVFCSASDKPDFARYFKAWTVVEHVAWDPAFHLVGDALLKCEQGPRLFVVGDHNVCTLEDAYLTGLYAANRILDR
ncbi:MAG: FAD-dependent oxidoreductase [Acidimicrobiia bacterium]|nr:FAD-dependent oxidoreductase [Acidimicrobiia bacterium]